MTIFHGSCAVAPLKLVEPMTRTIESMTASDKHILEFFRETIRKRGYPPTLREVSSEMDYASVNAVGIHIKRLVRLGELVEVRDKSTPFRYMPRESAGVCTRCGRPFEK